MTARALDRGILAVAAAVLLAVGAASVVAPAAFLGGYGVRLGTDAALLSELRAAGALIVALGAVVGWGALRPGSAVTSALVATVAYGAYAVGRGVSWVVDGDPGPGMLGAGVAESALALASGWVLWRLRRTRSGQ